MAIVEAQFPPISSGPGRMPVSLSSIAKDVLSTSFDQAPSFEMCSYDDRTEDKTIHSGHFMLSRVHDDRDEDSAEESVSLKPGELSVSSPVSSKGSPPGQTSKAGPAGSSLRSQIDLNLNRLFKCLSIAYCQNMVSPKWNNFKGLRLTLKEKIRLNNIIWREWHRQFKLSRSPVVCQFDTPIKDEPHNRTENCLMEGKYWKRQTKLIKAEYQRWRTFSKNRLAEWMKTNGVLMGLFDRPSRTAGSSRTTSECRPSSPPTSMAVTVADHFSSDNLFNSLSPPFEFPGPRDFNFLSNADLLQPSLLPMQPNLDVMDIDFDQLDDFEFSDTSDLHKLTSTYSLPSDYYFGLAQHLTGPGISAAAMPAVGAAEAGSSRDCLPDFAVPMEPAASSRPVTSDASAAGPSTAVAPAATYVCHSAPQVEFVLGPASSSLPASMAPSIEATPTPSGTVSPSFYRHDQTNDTRTLEQLLASDEPPSFEPMPMESMSLTPALMDAGVDEAAHFGSTAVVMSPPSFRRHSLSQEYLEQSPFGANNSAAVPAPTVVQATQTTQFLQGNQLYRQIQIISEDGRTETILTPAETPAAQPVGLAPGGPCHPPVPPLRPGPPAHTQPLVGNTSIERSAVDRKPPTTSMVSFRSRPTAGQPAVAGRPTAGPQTAGSLAAASAPTTLTQLLKAPTPAATFQTPLQPVGRTGLRRQSFPTNYPVEEPAVFRLPVAAVSSGSSAAGSSVAGSSTTSRAVGGPSAAGPSAVSLAGSRNVVELSGKTAAEIKKTQHTRNEKFRRSQIRNQFEQLRELVPSLGNSAGKARMSKARLLQRVADHVKLMRERRHQLVIAVNNRRREIERLKEAIHAKQSDLPAAGVDLGLTDVGDENRTPLATPGTSPPSASYCGGGPPAAAAAISGQDQRELNRRRFNQFLLNETLKEPMFYLLAQLWLREPSSQQPAKRPTSAHQLEPADRRVGSAGFVFGNSRQRGLSLIDRFFAATESCRSYADLQASTLQFIEAKASLVALRPLAAQCLLSLSRETSILRTPSQLACELAAAARTELGATADTMFAVKEEPFELASRLSPVGAPPAGPLPTGPSPAVPPPMVVDGPAPVGATVTHHVSVPPPGSMVTYLLMPADVNGAGLTNTSLTNTGLTTNTTPAGRQAPLQTVGSTPMASSSSGTTFFLSQPQTSATLVGFR